MVIHIQGCGTAIIAAPPPTADVVINKSMYSLATVRIGRLGSVNPDPGIALTLWFRNAVPAATNSLPVDSHTAGKPWRTADHTPAATAIPLKPSETLDPTVTSEAMLPTAATTSIATAISPPPSASANAAPVAICRRRLPLIGGSDANALAPTQYNAQTVTAAAGKTDLAPVAATIKTTTAAAAAAAAMCPARVESMFRIGSMIIKSKRQPYRIRYKGPTALFPTQCHPRRITMPFGFWTVASLNFSVCAMPKCGSTMNRAVLAKAAGVLGDACFYSWNNDIPLVTKTYSPNTTNILIVRDPWTRAVSQFADQKARKQIDAKTSFLEYLTHNATRTYTHHTGTAAGMCAGMPGARFDHIINIESKSSFARVARLVPAYGSLVDHGWERCTGGDPRLYMPGSIATHANKDRDMPSRLCTPKNLDAVCKVYAADYALYARLGHPFKCACKREISSP